MIQKTGKKLRMDLIGLLVLIGCLLLAFPVLADDTGDGSGGGKNIALDLVSSSPADGQKDVSLTGDIKLTFNKNVIYLQIRDANKACFSLTTAEGSKVPIEVIMADDQTPEGFEQRRDISIRPLQELKPGTAYIVKVSPELQAKNGMSLGHEDTVNFVTSGIASQPSTAAPAADTDKGQGETGQAAATATIKDAPVGEVNNSSVAEQAPNAEEQVSSTKENLPATAPVQDQTSSMPNVLAAGLVVLAALGYVYFRQRNKR